VSRIHEALRKSELENRQSELAAPELPKAVQVVNSATPQIPGLAGPRCVTVRVSPEAHLVALTAPFSLGAEKFRVLATRIENLRKDGAVKSLQVTSGSTNEGKSLVSGNLAFTLARRTNSKVLLIEGDLHKPALASMLGLDQPQGLSQWWSEPDGDITRFMYQLNDMPLWLLGAGKAFDQPSDILQSARFGKAFAQLARSFDWIVVDSTPLLPMADVNLWSRWVDGTLLVVREGVAPISALRKGLAGLDNAKLIGVVLNEASEFDRAAYYDGNYASRRNGTNGQAAEKTTEDIA
jgi:capsular exopolysaccharide synthesis family protein